MLLFQRAVALTLLAAVCLLARPADEAPLPPNQRMVVVITLDGFPAYALEDPKLPVPTLRKLIHDGVWARRMTVVNPAVTWPNHTTLVTGVLPLQHGLLYNGTAVRTGTWPPVKIDYTIEKEKMVHATTVYDLAHRAGLTTAQIDWVAINHAPTITWEFPELATTSDPLVQEMIERGAIFTGDVKGFRHDNIVWRDQIWTKAAEYLIREHKPNLLLLHFLSLDSTQHRFGPKTLAAEDAMAFLDSCVAHVIDAIREVGLEDRTTIVIGSDHGFKQFHKQIRPAVALRAAGLEQSAFVVSEGGSAMIYLRKPADHGLAEQVRQALSRIEGIARIEEPADFPSLGLPDPAKDSQAPDLILYAKSDYAFGRGGKDDTAVVVTRDFTAGAHGYMASDPDMDAIFIASGYGVRHGVVLDQIQNVDVAPTLATLLGVELPQGNAKALTQALNQDLISAPGEPENAHH